MCPNPLGVSMKSFQTPTLILKLSMTFSKWDFKRYSIFIETVNNFFY